MKLAKYHIATAAEAIAAAQFARLGCNVAVQYGANQPEYDLIIDDKVHSPMRISVKGSQGKTWPLAASMKKGKSYHDAIDAWLQKHDPKIVFCLVAFFDVKSLDMMPPVYVAGLVEIATVMKAHAKGRGHGALHLGDVPQEWRLKPERLASLWALR